MTFWPLRTTSVWTATTETVISEKLMKALLMADLMGTTASRISVIFMPGVIFMPNL